MSRRLHRLWVQQTLAAEDSQNLGMIVGLNQKRIVDCGVRIIICDRLPDLNAPISITNDHYPLTINPTLLKLLL